MRKIKQILRRGEMSVVVRTFWIECLGKLVADLVPDSTREGRAHFYSVEP